MSDTIFLSSDLAKKRTEVLAAARNGIARVRDKDGTGYVMLPEGRLSRLEALTRWQQALIRLEALLRRGAMPSVADLGDLAWLRGFDLEELSEFADELREALVAAHADDDVAALEDCLRAWRTTARQLADPLRRSVLRGSHQPDEFTEVAEPDGSD
jgi:1-acyl-sn-glycerol-3-phosphate acyltransferase